MRHLMLTRTPVRFGVTDGAIDVTFTAVGKVSDTWGVGVATPYAALRACAISEEADMAFSNFDVRFTPKIGHDLSHGNVRFVPIADIASSVRLARSDGDDRRTEGSRPSPSQS
jgi:hypothetical protein